MKIAVFYSQIQNVVWMSKKVLGFYLSINCFSATYSFYLIFDTFWIKPGPELRARQLLSDHKLRINYMKIIY